MPSRQDFKDAFLSWARRSFGLEVTTCFQRAQTFDCQLSAIVLSALRDFSSEKLQIMAEALPTGAASTGPTGENMRTKLTPGERRTVEEFQEAVQRVRQERWEALSDHIARMRQRDTLDEAKRIRKVGLEIVKEMAGEWQYTAEKITPALWALSSSSSWGKISVHFDFESTMEIRYGIFAYDPRGTPIRRNDHYLGVLGLGPSGWSVTTVDECAIKVVKACEFIRWHVAEYEKLMVYLQTH